MSTYQVFVERPSSTAPEALARLANAMAERFGVARDELEPRLRAGRFRVKTSPDRETAERFAVDLERLGAVVSVVDGNGATIARGRPSTTPPPGRPSQASYQVGLAAAQSAPDEATDLGALGGESGAFALSALDGSDDHPAVSGAFEPPASAALPASIGPAIPAAASQGAIDMFAPPDAEAPMDVDLGVAAYTGPKKRATMASTPPPSQPRTAGRTTGAPPPSLASLDAPPAPLVVDRGRLAAFAAQPRARFATGALLAVLLGFAPAHFLASVREKSAFAEIDARLIDKQAHVQSLEEWNALDHARESFRDQKVAEKHSIALLSLLLWAAVSAGVAFVWFRRIDWDRLAAS